MKTTTKNNSTMKKVLFFIYCSLFTGLAPCLAQDLLVCNSKGFTLTSADAANGVKTPSYAWTENGGSTLTGKNGSTLHIDAGKASGTYQYVRWAFSEDCTEGVQSNTFTVVVLEPATPTISVTPETVCYGAGNVVFSISEADNTTYTWTKVAGDNGAASGGKNGSYTLSSPSANTHTVKATATVAYTVGVLTKSCTSGHSAEKSAVVYPLPEVSPTGTFARCGAGTLTLSVTASAGGSSDGITVKWYGENDDSKNALQTGLTYAPTLTEQTANYYVGAVVEVTGCKAASLTEVTATINVLPGTIGGQEDQ